MHGPAGFLVGGPGGYMVAHEILVSAQGPSVLGFWAKGLGPGLDNSCEIAQLPRRRQICRTLQYKQCLYFKTKLF